MTVREILAFVNDLLGISIFDSRKLKNGGQTQIGRYENKQSIPEWILDSKITLIDCGFDSDLWLDIIVEETDDTQHNLK